MGLGLKTTSILGPSAPWCAQNNSALRVSPVFLFLDLQGTNSHKAQDSLPVLRFAVRLEPCSANNTSFKLQDGWSRSELTLCIFDSGYWWSTSLRLRRHKGLFVPDFAVSRPCALLVAFCFLLPHLLPWERSTLKARLFNSPSFLFLLLHNFFIYFFLYFPNMSLQSHPPHFQCRAQPPCPGPACPAADLAFVGKC